MSGTKVILHDYWRSGASYRVRIALNLKGVPYELAPHDLRIGAQQEPAYTTIAPQGLVPALEADGLVLTQSPAILEWIEERWPQPALLPADRDARAIVRSMCALIACDIHPLNNLRVLKAVRQLTGNDESAEKAWITRWITAGFEALEILVSQYGRRFSYGDSITLADCTLVPQLFSAERFGVDLTAFPHLVAVGLAANSLAPVQSAHPTQQPDAQAL